MNFDCGIYAITTPSGKQYIGQASSFKRRWMVHQSDLRLGRHANKGLQNAYKKYGEKGLVFSKIAIVPLDQLDQREQEQIDSRPRKMIYNISLFVGKPTKGRKLSEETRAKIRARKALFNPHKGVPKTAAHRAKVSLAMTGRKRPPEFGRIISEKLSGGGNGNARRVICVETGQIFESASLAAASVGDASKARFRRGKISTVCRGPDKTAYGYTWRYVDDEGNPLPHTVTTPRRTTEKARSARKSLDLFDN